MNLTIFEEGFFCDARIGEVNDTYLTRHTCLGGSLEVCKTHYLHEHKLMGVPLEFPTLVVFGQNATVEMNHTQGLLTGGLLTLKCLRRTVMQKWMTCKCMFLPAGSIFYGNFPDVVVRMEGTIWAFTLPNSASLQFEHKPEFVVLR